MPRIIAGKARGTQLIAPPGLDTRPTADKTKEALFSILTNKIADARFLDLYAGTGQIGLEALSRGAAEVVLVEHDRHAIKAIQANIQKTHLDHGCRLLTMEAAKAIQILLSEKQSFNLIYLDPPYAIAAESLKSMARALSSGLLAPSGTVILEHESSMPPPANVTNLQFVRSCKYGTAMLSFYQYPAEGLS